MTDISLEAVTGKLNRVGYDAFIQALAPGQERRQPQCRAGALAAPYPAAGAHRHRAHRRSLQARPRQAADRPRRRRSPASARTKPRCRASPTTVIDMLDRGWHYATLFFGETQIRTGHLLVGALKSPNCAARSSSISQEFAKINVDALASEHRTIWAGSEEENLRPMDGSGLAARPARRARSRQPGQRARRRSIAFRRT